MSEDAPELSVTLEKKADGACVLRCVRRDGTATYERHEGRQGAFFPLHDLTHLAVETELGKNQGFFGLIADGWDILDTTGKGARGPAPPGAIEVEKIVGLVDLERAGAAAWEAEDLGLTPAQIERLRRRVDDLIARWRALPVGGALELTFSR